MWKRRGYCEVSARARWNTVRAAYVIPQEQPLTTVKALKSGRLFRRAYAGESTFDYLPQRYGKTSCC